VPFATEPPPRWPRKCPHTCPWLLRVVLHGFHHGQEIRPGPQQWTTILRRDPADGTTKQFHHLGPPPQDSGSSNAITAFLCGATLVCPVLSPACVANSRLPLHVTPGVGSGPPRGLTGKIPQPPVGGGAFRRASLGGALHPWRDRSPSLPVTRMAPIAAAGVGRIQKAAIRYPQARSNPNLRIGGAHSNESKGPQASTREVKP
jgi:hypothetical protein